MCGSILNDKDYKDSIAGFCCAMWFHMRRIKAQKMWAVRCAIGISRASLRPAEGIGAESAACQPGGRNWPGDIRARASGARDSGGRARQRLSAFHAFHSGKK